MPPRPRSQLEILAQPDDSTCGPTCLHAVYRHFGDALPLDGVVGEVEAVATGGTLGVNLARHALRRGYSAAIYTYNLDIFDPTWFARPGELPQRLRAQAQHKRSARLREDSPYYERTIEIARLFSDAGFAVISGGGPGIMEAANKGAHAGKSASVGLNITMSFTGGSDEASRALLEELGFPFVREEGAARG